MAVTSTTFINIGNLEAMMDRVEYVEAQKGNSYTRLSALFISQWDAVCKSTGDLLSNADITTILDIFRARIEERIVSLEDELVGEVQKRRELRKVSEEGFKDSTKKKAKAASTS